MLSSLPLQSETASISAKNRPYMYGSVFKLQENVVATTAFFVEASPGATS